MKIKYQEPTPAKYKDLSFKEVYTSLKIQSKVKTQSEHRRLQKSLKDLIVNVNDELAK